MVRAYITCQLHVCQFRNVRGSNDRVAKCLASTHDSSVKSLLSTEES